MDAVDMRYRITDIPEELLSALLDNPYESLILIDKDGIIRFMSSSNEGIYNVSVKDAIGRHITEVSPDTRLHLVLETDKAEIGESMVLKDKKRIVARLPISKDGRIIGAAGKLMFLHPEKLKELFERIDVLEHHIDYYRHELNQLYGSKYSFDNIIGQSDKTRAVKALAIKAAASDSPVMVMGESGTGKELYAHAIYEAGLRHKNAFIRVNCAAIPNELFESELFGYEKGAFTGAHPKGKPGKFELADNGTIFLDEIGDLPLNMQAKLLRVLQEKEVEPVGSRTPKKVNFRLISATNKDLESVISKGKFRLDLFYRINLLTIQLPPLREVKEDIPVLINHFLKELTRDRKTYTISDQALSAMMQYNWPGNVRELKNVIERAMIVAKGDSIAFEDLQFSKQKSFGNGQHLFSKGTINLKQVLETTERDTLAEALKISQNNRVKAARYLGIHRTGLYQKMKKYGLD